MPVRLRVVSVDEWLTVKEAAARLGVSAETIRRRRVRGELQSRQRERDSKGGFEWVVLIEAEPAGEPSPAPSYHNELIEQLRSEIEYLRTQNGALLSALEREQQVLLAAQLRPATPLRGDPRHIQGQEYITAATVAPLKEAPVTGAYDPPRQGGGGAPSMMTRGRRWWRRLFSG